MKRILISSFTAPHADIKGTSSEKRDCERMREQTFFLLNQHIRICLGQNKNLFKCLYEREFCRPTPPPHHHPKASRRIFDPARLSRRAYDVQMFSHHHHIHIYVCINSFTYSLCDAKKWSKCGSALLCLYALLHRAVQSSSVRCRHCAALLSLRVGAFSLCVRAYRTPNTIHHHHHQPTHLHTQTWNPICEVVKKRT